MTNTEYKTILAGVITIHLLNSFLMLRNYVLNKFNKQKYNIKIPISIKRYFYRDYVKITVENNKQVKEYIKTYGYPWDNK